MKFKIGDKVKYKDGCIKNCSTYKVFVIKKTNSCDKYYLVSESNNSDKEYIIFEEDLELIDELTVKNNKPTKDELLDMPKGTKIFTDAKENNEFVYGGNRFNSLNKFLYKSNISDDLKIINIDSTFSDDFGTHITKIEVPKDYETVYIYEEETMESLRKLNEELTKKVTELKRKLYEKNSQDVNISKQEIDIINDFFERR